MANGKSSYPTEAEINKMTKLELGRLLYRVNTELYFRTKPRLTTTKNYRVICIREIKKLKK
jgi:hypothetical protein